MSTNDVKPVPEGWPPRGGGSPKIPAAGILAGGILAFVLVFGLVMGISGKLGFVSVDADQVAVKVNYLSGDNEVINTPGFKIYIPILQDIFLFDKTPQEFVMAGSKFLDNNHVAQLTVRANDGSNLLFDDLVIQYRLLPGQADKVLNDSGAGDRFKSYWIRAYARSILRDEFGKYSSEELANPTLYGQATTEGENRLNAILNDHGMEVIRIFTPKPTFDDAYEKAIEDRKIADQDVERLIAMEDQLKREREQRIAAVEKEKEIEMRSLQGDLKRALIDSERESIRQRKSADAFAVERRAKGMASKAEMVAQARGLIEKFTKEAEGLVAKANALEQRGTVVVREALIKKLRNIRFTLVPYSRDPAPRRLEHVDDPKTAAKSSSTRIDESSFSQGGNQ